MEIIRETVEALVRLAKAEIHGSAVLVFPEDPFEVTDTPSLILRGPALVENTDRRTVGNVIERDIPALTYTESRHPRLYHLDFEIIITTTKGNQLLALTEKTSRFFARHPSLEVPGRGRVNLTEIIPVGGLGRVNLSNLRQASGKCRIEDCPVWDERIIEGKLVLHEYIEIIPEEIH